MESMGTEYGVRSTVCVLPPLSGLLWPNGAFDISGSDTGQLKWSYTPYSKN